MNKSLFFGLLIAVWSSQYSCKPVGRESDPTPDPPAKNVLALIPTISGSRLDVLDLSTNQPKWSYQGQQRLYPEIYKDLVFFVDQAKLNAVSLTTGAVQWQKWVGRRSVVEYSRLSVVDGTLFFCTPGDDIHPNQFYAIDALTGNIKWSFADSALNVDDLKKRYILNDTYQLIDQSRGIIYFTIQFAEIPRRLYAFDLKTGEKKWVYMPKDFYWVCNRIRIRS